MSWSDNLDGVHLDIASATDNPNRVMAGPGTGKSYAMKRRLMRLLAEGVAPDAILAVTFTRTAAADMVKEIRDLGVDGCDKIAAGTLHSFCFRLLLRTGVLAWTKRVPRPLVTFSDKGLLRFEVEPMLEDLDRSGDFGDLRAATGLGLNWASPIGPMKISLGFPVRKLPGDRVQRIQFQVGTGF